jgi:hypothetical protein
MLNSCAYSVVAPPASSCTTSVCCCLFAAQLSLVVLSDACAARLSSAVLSAPRQVLTAVVILPRTGDALSIFLVVLCCAFSLLLCYISYLSVKNQVIEMAARFGLLVGLSSLDCSASLALFSFLTAVLL